MIADADVLLHMEIERALSEPQKRDRKGRWLPKPTARSVIHDAFRAHYCAKSAAVSALDVPTSCPASEPATETAAEPLLPAWSKIHIMLGITCLAVAFLGPDFDVIERLVYLGLGTVCLGRAYWLAK